jgi:hypothetical protein
MAFKIMWDNGCDCGVFSEIYATEEAAELAAQNWVFEMCTVDGDDPYSEDCPYGFDIIEAEDEPSEDEKEEAAAAEEQSLDYFNRYIAGDR